MYVALGQLFGGPMGMKLVCFFGSLACWLSMETWLVSSNVAMIGENRQLVTDEPVEFEK